MLFYKKMNPTNKFIEMLYRSKTEQYSDGSKLTVIQYLSSFNIWMYSNETFEALKDRLIPISKKEFKLLKEVN